MSVRVRFAPSPTGSLHVGNALTAVANRRFADERGGVVVLRIDDTDPSRTVAGGEEAILEDLAWLGVGFDEGPVRQSERGSLYAAAAERALESGAAKRDDEGAVRLGTTTLARPDGTATYQLASVVDDLELGITHVIRGSDHRPNLELHRRIARAVGGELPEVIHHGLVLGEDGKKLSKRHGHSSIAELREEGFPAGAVRAYLDELGLPEHDVHLDLARLRRLAIDAIAGDAGRGARGGGRRAGRGRPRPARRPLARRGARVRAARPLSRACGAPGGRRADARALLRASLAAPASGSTSRLPARSCAS